MAPTTRTRRAPAATDGASPAPTRRRSAKTSTAAAVATTRRTRKEVAATDPDSTAASGTDAPASTRRGRQAPGADTPAGRSGADGAAAPSPRQRVRAETLDRILSIAHDRLVSGGADALSLRSVARELGMVSSAVYRYVASREELLRLLAARAGYELSEAVEAASRSRRGDASRRFTAIARAVRTWALEHPGDFGLLYGRVGTVAAGEGATQAVPEPGSGALGLPAALVRLYGEGDAPAGARPAPAARRELASLSTALGVEAGPEVTARALLAWSALAGAVAVEVSGQLTGVVANPSALFDLEVDRLAAATGLAA